MSVVQLLQQLLGYINILLAQVGGIYQTLVASRITIVIHDTAAEVSQTLATVTSPTYGLATIEGQIVSMQAQLTTLLVDVVALGAPQQTGSPVTLPTTPPTGYGGASASAIWSYVPSGTTRQTGDLLITTGEAWSRLTDILGVVAMPEYPYWGFAGPWDEPTAGNAHPGALQVIDPTTIISSDTTPYEWLHRAYPSAPFFNAGGGVAGSTTDSDSYTYLVLLNVVEFQQLKAWVLNGSLGGPAPIVAPVWPGIANVTYGDTQSMDAPNGSLSGPADGYKIIIDAVPSWAGKFDFGDVQSWRNVGAIAFVDDEGVAEPAQTLGLATVIYTPQRMAHTVGAYYRIATGYHASATPFLINS